MQRNLKAIDSKTLVILGMHRSGTSMIGFWLWEMGLNLGDKLYEASEFNPNGYYEDVKFMELHKSILKNHGLDQGGHERIHNLYLSSADREAISALVNQKLNQKQWGWKDPRTVLFLKYYQEILPEATYLIIYRSWQEVVRSMIKREKGIDIYELKIEKSFLKSRIKNFKEIREYLIHYSRIWVIYNKKILNSFSAEDKNVIFTTSFDIQMNDEAIFDRLKQNGFNLKFIPFKIIYDKNLMRKPKPEIFKFLLSKKLQSDINSIDRVFRKRLHYGF